MRSDPIAAMLAVVQVLDRHGIEYLVGGSMASATYGIYRPTQDIDLVADLRPEHVESWVGELASEFYVDAGAVRAAIHARGSFNAIYLPTMDKIDVFVVEPIPWAREEMRRRQVQHIKSEHGAAEVWFASPEDLVLQKLRWFRMGGETSERQWHDVLGVLKVQRRGIDLVYLDRWAEDLAVQDLLMQALRDAGIASDSS